MNRKALSECAEDAALLSTSILWPSNISDILVLGLEWQFYFIKLRFSKLSKSGFLIQYNDRFLPQCILLLTTVAGLAMRVSSLSIFYIGGYFRGTGSDVVCCSSIDTKRRSKCRAPGPPSRISADNMPQRWARKRME
jgi:hypothetical protein